MFGYMYDERFLEHDTGDHLEIYNRCYEIDFMVKESFDFERIPTRTGKKEELYKVHDESYVDWVEKAYENGIRNIISSDTVISEKSYESALIAATSTKNVVKYFKQGGRYAFLNLRPPGHHAEIITGQGFCIFNNIALMARYAQEIGYEKVLIIDFDVHHGNGTQDIFYSDDTVFYFSIHERDNYPYFTGSSEETGVGKGEGYTLNIPYGYDLEDDEFLKFFDLLPKNFDFDIVLVSAGYDLMKDEQISTSLITYEGLQKSIEKILNYSGDKPVAFLLEGGYNISSLVESVRITISQIESK